MVPKNVLNACFVNMEYCSVTIGWKAMLMIDKY